MSSPHTVTLSRKASQRSVIEAARQLAEAADTGAQLDLDLTALSGIEPAWGAVLSNVLVGGLRSAGNLSVQMPEAVAANAQLARAGLYFALARHPGLDWEHLHGWRSELRRWTVNWEPANLQEPLFDFDDQQVALDEPDPFAHNLVAFLNPDRAPREEAPDDQAAVVYPWLRKLMLHRGAINEADELRLHKHISKITWELLDNIRTHANLDRNAHSSLATFATRGRPNRLHLCVMDTGIGIPASLAERFPESASSDQLEFELVRKALLGRLKLRDRSRGDGLLQILKIAGAHKGSRFFLASGPTLDGGAVVCQLEGGSPVDDLKIHRVPNLQVRGTVVLVTLPFGVTSAPGASGTGIGATGHAALQFAGSLHMPAGAGHGQGAIG